MKKLLLIALFAIGTITTQAQVDAKYLKGAVPEVDGKIAFTKTIVLNKKTTNAKLFDVLNKWANENYSKKDDSRQKVLLSDKKKLDIACLGDTKLVFAKTFLMLDQAKMQYQLILQIEEPSHFEVTIRNIKYDYEEKTNTPADELISDKVALKGTDNLFRGYNKFRIATIDSVQAIFNSLEEYINGKVTVTKGAVESAITLEPIEETQIIVQEVVQQPVAVAVSSNVLRNGFREITTDKIPSKYKQPTSDKVIISWKSSDTVETAVAQWNGTDNFWDKLVAFDIVDLAKVKGIEKGTTYTISFFTDVYSDAVNNMESTGKIGDGLTSTDVKTNAPAFAEAWMIVECNKLDTPASLAIDKSKGELQVGEIQKVWVK